MFQPVEGLDGVLRLELTTHPDERGRFHEWFKASSFEEATGFPLDVQQANMSTSKAGVIRGLHYSEVPPAQAKLVTVPAGRITDVVVDVRAGSPTFGRWRAIEIGSKNPGGVYIPGGFAHGFFAHEDSGVCYLTTAEYDPEREHAITPFSREIGVEWPAGDYILSEKDRGAPEPSQAVLPTFDEARDFVRQQRDGWALANEAAGEEA